MVIRKALVALASAGLVIGSTAANAAPVADVRAASPVEEADAIGGGAWVWILALIVAAGVVGIVASDSDEEVPTSP